MNRRDALKGLAALFASPIVLPKLKQEFVLDHISSYPTRIGPIIFENAENVYEVWRDRHNYRYKRLHNNYFVPLRQSHNYYHGQGNTDHTKLIERGNSQRIDSRRVRNLATFPERSNTRSGESRSVLQRWVSDATKHQYNPSQSYNNSGRSTEWHIAGRSNQYDYKKSRTRRNEDKRRELHFRPATRRDISFKDTEREVNKTIADLWTGLFTTPAGFQGFTT